jgi:PAS domain-containing protein
VTSGVLYSLVEGDGTVTARQAVPGEARGDQHAVAPLARAGAPLLVRVDALRGPPRFIPNLLTGLVAATSVGLGLAMFFLVRDVRQRARVEHALREQVTFRRAVEDAMLHGLAVYDLDGRVVQVNAAMSRLTGYGREEPIGRRPPLPFSTPRSRAASRRCCSLVRDSRRSARWPRRCRTSSTSRSPRSPAMRPHARTSSTLGRRGRSRCARRCAASVRRPSAPGR